MKEQKEKKIERCKYAHISHKRGYICVEAGWEDDKVIQTDEQRCEECQKFRSKYIEYPITVNKVETEKIEYNKDSWHCKMGQLVKVRPCGEEYGGKTYVGFYIGDLPLCTTGSYNQEEGIYHVGLLPNPAIFVPELRKIIFGCGSWWGAIKSPDEIKDITDDDISNVWYVKLAKAICGEEKKEG